MFIAIPIVMSKLAILHEPQASLLTSFKLGIHKVQLWPKKVHAEHCSQHADLITKCSQYSPLQSQTNRTNKQPSLLFRTPSSVFPHYKAADYFQFIDVVPWKKKCDSSPAEVRCFSDVRRSLPFLCIW